VLAGCSILAIKESRLKVEFINLGRTPVKINLASQKFQTRDCRIFIEKQSKNPLHATRKYLLANVAAVKHNQRLKISLGINDSRT